jgi:hypothetical protein
MSEFPRRRFLQASSGMLTALGVSGLPAAVLGSSSQLSIAPFRIDVTTPNGHGCCGGWIKPIEAVDDVQEAIGFVLLGAGKPIVVCAVDWTGILNQTHVKWRTAMAEAAGTTADRAAVQCVHQHNAPFACLDAQRLVAEQGDLPNIMLPDFFEQCLDRLRSAISAAIPRAVPVTHIGQGKGRVSEVAANRRIHQGPDGKILGMRGSACTDPALRAMTEGLIDPWLRTIAFYSGEKKVVCCHYYATHPMSYYGDGRASSDFPGLARKQRQQDEPATTHLYFTGCAGNVAAGKYNDGTKGMRAILARRVYDGIVAANGDLKREPVDTAEWRTADILPTPRGTLNASQLAAAIANKQNAVVGRNRPAFELAWLQRVEAKIPIVLSCLQINDISMLHLPAESFVEYQLRAQELGTGRFVATAAYGDGGPWYIPVKEAYPQGGYEVSVAFSEPEIDDDLTAGIRKIV